MQHLCSYSHRLGSNHKWYATTTHTDQANISLRAGNSVKVDNVNIRKEHRDAQVRMELMQKVCFQDDNEETLKAIYCVRVWIKVAVVLVCVVVMV